jgi:hypothetical protein
MTAFFGMVAARFTRIAPCNARRTPFGKDHFPHPKNGNGRVGSVQESTGVRFTAKQKSKGRWRIGGPIPSSTGKRNENTKPAAGHETPGALKVFDARKRQEEATEK